MSHNHKEKFITAFNVLLAFFLDGLLVCGFVLITIGVQSLIEFVYGDKIENIENKALYIVSMASKVILISLFLIYGATHIILELKKAFKEVKGD